MPRVLDNTSIDFPGGTRTRELPVARLIGLRSLRKFDLLGVGERLRESILFFINRGETESSVGCEIAGMGTWFSWPVMNMHIGRPSMADCLVLRRSWPVSYATIINVAITC